MSKTLHQLRDELAEYALKEIRRGLIVPLTDIQIVESDMYERALNCAYHATDLVFERIVEAFRSDCCSEMNSMAAWLTENKERILK